MREEVESAADTVYATRHDGRVSLEEFYGNERLVLPRPDLSARLFPQLNLQVRWDTRCILSWSTCLR